MKQPDQLTFFLDRSLGKELIAKALRGSQVLVEVHDDWFPSNARDEEWLFDVGSRGWIVLTKDRRFHTRVLELSAIARSQAKVFKLAVANLQGAEMALIFAKAIRKISRVAIGNPGPFIATINKSGKVTIVLNSTKLRRYR